ncbi:MAG: hypothetical protein NT062_39680 [Proteobacteria bacterium]|nr:hypothetical protein [Pseudomonadota bacterium]
MVARSARGLVQFGSGRSSTLGDAGLVALTDIATLRVLELERAEIGAAGVASLIRHVPVEELVLTGNPLGQEGVAALCAATTLRELAIDETRFTSESIVAIAAAPGLASLRRLRLGYARSTLTPGDLQTLIDSPYLSRELVLVVVGHALKLESQYYDRDYAPEFNGLYWASEPTGPIAERFHVEVCGLPSS